MRQESFKRSMAILNCTFILILSFALIAHVYAIDESKWDKLREKPGLKYDIYGHKVIEIIPIKEHKKFKKIITDEKYDRLQAFVLFLVNPDGKGVKKEKIVEAKVEEIGISSREIINILRERMLTKEWIEAYYSSLKSKKDLSGLNKTILHKSQGKVITHIMKNMDSYGRLYNTPISIRVGIKKSFDKIIASIIIISLLAIISVGLWIIKRVRASRVAVELNRYKGVKG